MEEKTTQEIADIFSAAGDSVTLIGIAKTSEETAEDFKDNTLCDSEILINQDSFPEMDDKSVYRYIKNAKFNNVPYILSYNKSTTFEGGNRHSDWKSIILNFGYVPKKEIKSIINEYYTIELFELKN